MTLKRLQIILATLLISLFSMGIQAASASGDYQKMLGKLKGGIDAQFSVSGKQTVSGSFKASGSKFALVTKGLSVWYNGSHLYTYNASTNETTKVKPSSAELAESNPLLYVANNSSRFVASYGKAASSAEKVLILTPKNKKDEVERVVITLNSSTFLPKKVAMKMNGQSIVVSFSKFTIGAKFSASSFEYPQSKYPKVKIINL